MTEEKVKQFFELINGLSYQEWTVLSILKTLGLELVAKKAKRGCDT